MPGTIAIDRALPHNLEAERALLGSVLLDNGALNVALEVISKDDFFSEAHRLTFEKMMEISEKNRTIDLVTLAEELSKEGLLEKIGGAAYLAALTDGVPVGIDPRRRPSIRASSKKSRSFAGSSTPRTTSSPAAWKARTTPRP